MSNQDDDGIAELRSIVEKWSRASMMLDDRAIPHQLRLWSIVQILQKERWNEVLVEARRDQSPVMLTYMSDGWGCNISEAVLITLQCMSTNREVRKRSEFL